eukprot:tig00000042_g15550.t1
MDAAGGHDAAELPGDVLHLVFQSLEVPQLLRAAGVCRAWKQTAYSDPRLASLAFKPYHFRGLQAVEIQRQLERALAGPYSRVADVCLGKCPHLVGPFLAALRELGPAGPQELRSVNLKWAEATDDDVCSLAALCGPRLRRLNLFWSKEVTGLGLRAVADRGPPLCALNLGGVRCIMDEDLGHMLQRCCAGLLELRLFRCGWLTRPGLEAVAACPRLSLLVLSGCRGLDPADLARIPALAPSLTALHVSYCRISDEAVRAIGSGLPLLQVLNVSGTDVTDAGLDWGTPAEGGYALRELHARRCGLLRGAGLAALLGRCPRLALLDAGLNRRLDAAGAAAPPGAEAAAAAALPPTLQSLALEDVRTPPRFSRPPIVEHRTPHPPQCPWATDAFVAAAAARLPNLTRLDLTDCPGAGAGAVAAVAACCPRLEELTLDRYACRLPPGVTGGPPFGPFGPADPFGDPSAPAAASADLAPALRALLASCPRLRSLSLAFRRVGPSPAPAWPPPAPPGPPLALELLNASGALGDLGTALDPRRMPRLRVAKLFRAGDALVESLAAGSRRLERLELSRPCLLPPPRPGGEGPDPPPALSLPTLARLAAACPRLLSAVFGRRGGRCASAPPQPRPGPARRGPARLSPQWLLARFEPDSRERVGGATAIGPDAFV